MIYSINTENALFKNKLNYLMEKSDKLKNS